MRKEPQPAEGMGLCSGSARVNDIAYIEEAHDSHKSSELATAHWANQKVILVKCDIILTVEMMAWRSNVVYG